MEEWKRNKNLLIPLLGESEDTYKKKEEGPSKTTTNPTNTRHPNISSAEEKENLHPLQGYISPNVPSTKETENSNGIEEGEVIMEEHGDIDVHPLQGFISTI